MGFVSHHRKRFYYNNDVKLVSLDVYKNGVYLPKDGELFDRVEVNLPKKLEDITVTENGVYRCSEDYEGIGTVNVEIPVTYSFNKEFKLTRIKKDGKIYLAVSKDDVDLTEELNKNSDVTVFVNSIPLYPVDENTFISEETTGAPEVTKVCTVSVVLFGKTKIFEEYMPVYGETTLL